MRLRLMFLMTVLAVQAACTRAGSSRAFELEGGDCAFVAKGMKVVDDGGRTIGSVRSVSKALLRPRCTVSLTLEKAPEWTVLTENNCSVGVEEKTVLLRFSAIGYASPEQLQQGRPGCRVVSYKIGDPRYPR